MCEYVFLCVVFLLFFRISFDGFFSLILGTFGGMIWWEGIFPFCFVLSLLFVSRLKGNDEDDEDDE